MSVYKQGVFGASVTPKREAGTQKLSALSASAPSPAGTLWAVNFASWSTQLPNGQSPAALTLCRAAVTFGSGGEGGAATEEVLVDYPSQGGTLFVHAKDIRVDFVVTISGIDLAGQAFPPTLEAWLTNASASGRPTGPTLTELTRIVAPGGVFIERVPPRARGYRIYTLGIDQNVMQVLQQSSNATPVTEAVDHPVTGTVGILGVQTQDATWEAASNRSAYHPIAPNTFFLNVENLSGAITMQYRIQWVLELG